VLGPLIERPEVEEVIDDLRRYIDTWFELHPGDHVVFLSKSLLRQGFLSVTIAQAVLRWVLANPSDVDATWRISGLVWRFGRDPEYSSLWPDLFDRIALVITEAAAGGMNAQGQLDIVMANLSDHFGSGYWAARVDDVILSWLDLQDSMSPQVSGRFENSRFVSRVLSLVDGRRITETAPELFARLRIWVADWRQDDGFYRTESLRLVDACESRWRARNARSDEPPHADED
jgi:hypothetical protein